MCFWPWLWQICDMFLPLLKIPSYRKQMASKDSLFNSTNGILKLFAVIKVYSFENNVHSAKKNKNSMPYIRYTNQMQTIPTNTTITLRIGDRKSMRQIVYHNIALKAHSDAKRVTAHVHLNIEEWKEEEEKTPRLHLTMTT